MTSRSPLRATAAFTTVVLLGVAVLAADQLSKVAVVTHLTPDEKVHVIGDFLIFYLVRNPGAAFSLGTGVTWVFTIALAVVASVIVFLAARRVRSRRWAVVLGLLLGGVLGNLSDRLFRPPGFGIGYVVDFIWTPWMMPAIYNVADMFIVTMMICVALLVVLGVTLSGEKADTDAVTAASEASAGSSTTED